MKALLALVLSASFSVAATAQGKPGLNDPAVPIAPATTAQPAATTLDSTGIPGATDITPIASPVPPTPRGAAFRVGSTISMQLAATADSGKSRNGDTIHGTLTAPVRTTAGALLPAGTRVDGTVVSSARAGTANSAGILSLQLTHVGPVAVVTDVLDFNGQEGHKDVADSAPQKGTEAVAQAGVKLDFHVLQNGPVPGIIPGAKLDGPAGSTAGQPGAPQPSQPNARPGSAPGVNQTPINGGSQPVQTTAPGTGPGR